MLALSRNIMGTPMRGRKVPQRKGMLKRRVERRRVRRIHEGTSRMTATSVVRMAVRKRAEITKIIPLFSTK